MRNADRLASLACQDAWYEWLFGIMQPLAQAIFVRLQVIEKARLLND